MSTLKKINIYRRILTKSLTKNIGTSAQKFTVDPNQKIEIKKVLISRPNHRLGNLLLITPLVQDVQNTFPDCKIDLFVKGGLAPIVFENYSNIETIIELPKKPFKDLIAYFKVWTTIKKGNYDIVINVDKNSSSGRLSAQFANAKYKFFGADDSTLAQQHPDYTHIAKYPVYEFRDFLTHLNFPKNTQPIPPLNIKLTSSELAQGQKMVQELTSAKAKVITIFTYATDDKCYAPSWWEPFYARLLSEFPEYAILEVLPVENVSQIGFAAPSFYSKDIREIAAVIANTDIFIGADSGIMHLSSAALTPTVGLFSRANIEMYKPYSNNSVAINTNKGGIDDWMEVIHRTLNTKS